MTNGNKIIVLVIVFLTGGLLGYFLLPEQIVTVVKEVQVVKYYKASKVETRPDGTTIATNVDSGSTTDENTYSKTETNVKRFTVELGGMTNKSVYTHFQGSMWGPIVIGLHVNYLPSDKKMTAGAGIGVRF